MSPLWCTTFGHESCAQKGIRCESGTVPAAVSSSKKDFVLQCHWYNNWEGDKIRNKSEDLPSEINHSFREEKREEKYYFTLKLMLP